MEERMASPTEMQRSPTESRTKKEFFVREDSIVRQIWGKSDTIMVIFAGASAEFALNKTVDWLYFTGRLPKDPLGRLFSTVSYARQIVFSEKSDAVKAIKTIAHIHKEVEAKRGATIPQWAYRDVLFMLIDHSIRAFELLERPMTLAEKEDVVEVFINMGREMGIEGLPDTFPDWQQARSTHMRQDLTRSRLTDDLYSQYKTHLGWMRYQMLIELQTLIVPQPVKDLLEFRTYSYIKPMIPVYKLIRWLKADRIIKELILPQQYKKEINAMDIRDRKERSLFASVVHS